MSYRLGLLDKSPVAPGTIPGEALEASVAYADLADRLGYHRFWVAEHHGTAFLASATPEILASHLLARTRRIRIGTGGVLLQHYSPYKVAEIFGVLSTLAPGRVDLGIGRTPGGLPLGTTTSLQPGDDPALASGADLVFLSAPEEDAAKAPIATLHASGCRPLLFADILSFFGCEPGTDRPALRRAGKPAALAGWTERLGVAGLRFLPAFSERDLEPLLAILPLIAIPREGTLRDRLGLPPAPNRHVPAASAA